MKRDKLLVIAMIVMLGLGIGIGFNIQKDIEIVKDKTSAQDPNSEYLTTPIIRCYFTSTYGDITREEDLNCAYLDKYYKSEFNTVHVDSLPHGYIK